jgi:hypothetical protein
VHSLILLTSTVAGPTERTVVILFLVVGLVQVDHPVTAVAGGVVAVVAISAKVGSSVSSIILYPDPLSTSAADNSEFFKTIRTKGTASHPFYLRLLHFFPTSTAWYLLIHNITSNCIFVCSLDPIRPG